MILNQVYKSCSLSFGDRKFSADLLLILMHDFDIILGMDWLTTYHASVDCFSKEIIFKIPREIEFWFQGNHNNYRGLICVLKANKMLTKKCEGILAYVVTDNNSEISFGDIQVVKEISDVFPEELPDLSPN